MFVLSFFTNKYITTGSLKNVYGIKTKLIINNIEYVDSSINLSKEIKLI